MKDWIILRLDILTLLKMVKVKNNLNIYYLFYFIVQSIPYKYQKFDSGENELLSKYLLFGSQLSL